jgi:3-oxoacyl-[acyl-carrier protein] reductase
MSKDKSVVWVTGASSGIGKTAAIKFAHNNCIVYASSRNAAGLKLINNELKPDKLEVEILPCNVASYKEVEQAAKEIIAKGKIDCLINNAGITSYKLAEKNSIDEINDIINTNLLGSIYTIKSILPKMIEQQSGTIINIISIVAEEVFTRSTVYSASKAGLLAYAKSLREEVREHNIKVINIIPGATETPMWSKETRNKFKNRMMDPQDVAELIVWAFKQNKNIVPEEIIVRPIQGNL